MWICQILSDKFEIFDFYLFNGYNVSMMKIWGKIIADDKIIKNKTIIVNEKNTSFFDMLKDLCASLNIPTPVLLDKHVYDFNLFNMCTFRADDFIESVCFDKFTLEYLFK